jgi:hypothetical protein
VSESTPRVWINTIFEQVDPFLHCSDMSLVDVRKIRHARLEYDVRGDESWWSCFNTSGSLVNASSSLLATRTGKAKPRSRTKLDSERVLGEDMSLPRQNLILQRKRTTSAKTLQKVSRPRFELRTFCDQQMLDRCDNQLRHRPLEKAPLQCCIDS